MSDQKISALLGLSVFTAPFAALSSVPNSRFTSPPEAIAPPHSHRTSLRFLAHGTNPARSIEPMGTYVGELQEKWQFPSDHLPIGMTLGDIHLASWNVLNAKYIGWVTDKNSQGLSRSLIADEHVYLEGSKLTLRDKRVAALVVQMAEHPTHPRSLISLQECGEPFLEELRIRLPSHFEIVSHGQDAVLVDRRHFEVVQANEIAGIFADEPARTLQDLFLRRIGTDETLRLVNAHLPGDPNKPGRFEFAQYLAQTFDAAVPTIAMGDMNFNELEMADAVSKAFPENSPFSVHTPYCTNISPYTHLSKAIDHFFVYSGDGAKLALSAPEEVMFGLKSLTDLLRG